MWFLYPLADLGRKKNLKKNRDSGHLPLPSTPCFLLQKGSMLSPHSLAMVQVCPGRVDWQNKEWQAKLRASLANAGNKQEK